MKLEQKSGDVSRRAAVHAALGDPARVQMVDALALSDRSPGELGSLLRLPTNLLAHHLNVLERVGAVARTRSEHDRRRTYVRLVPGALAGVAAVPSAVADRLAELTDGRVVFACTANSARSQLAAASWRQLTGGEAASAGTEPADRVHPGAVAAARRHGLDLRGASTARLDDVLTAEDLLVAVCDHAYESLHRTAARGLVHWSVADPVPLNSLEAFAAAFSDIVGRIRYLAARGTT
jgi:protein-tyrosine-phosphatase/DNA-binding HxlR family transcriptional regulator